MKDPKGTTSSRRTVKGSTASTKTAKSAADFFPARLTIPAMRTASKGCRGCHLWKVGTQTVFGEGSRRPLLLIVGEQPGDQEDRAGRPFVGPSGKLLDAALEKAGVDRADAYVTNAVKHFKWTPDARGKRRIHQTPNAAEIGACHPWLDAEIDTLRPRVLLALGATATKAVFGSKVKVMAQRGRAIETERAGAGFVTVHPSAVLRSPGGDERRAAEKAFFADIMKVARYLKKL